MEQENKEDLKEQDPQPQKPKKNNFWLLLILIFAVVGIGMVIRGSDCLRCCPVGAANSQQESNIPALNEADFDQTISDGNSMVYFWATWCPPCSDQSKIVEKIAAEVEDIYIGKVDVDQQPGLAGRFEVDFLPTLIFFKNGTQTERFEGLQDKNTITQAINRLNQIENQGD